MIELITDSEPEGFRVLATGETIAVRDYARVYATPGLYEAVVQDALVCRSPQVCVKALLRHCPDPAAARVLDLGAGVGVVGELLRAAGVDAICGVDSFSMARVAAQRDRPGVYDTYLVGECTESDVSRAVERFAPTAIACAGALGSGHLPARGLARMIGLLPPGGVVALTIDPARLDVSGDEGIGAYLEAAKRTGILRRIAQAPFLHRYTVAGEPIEYHVLVLMRLNA